MEVRTRKCVKCGYTRLLRRFPKSSAGLNPAICTNCRGGFLRKGFAPVTEVVYAYEFTDATAEEDQQEIKKLCG